LIAGGLPEEKIGRVVGLSSTALLDKSKSDNPINRRISIVVINARTEQAIQQESAALFSVQHTETGGATLDTAAPSDSASIAEAAK
jgi:chemotaxis protein MotB